MQIINLFLALLGDAAFGLWTLMKTFGLAFLSVLLAAYLAGRWQLKNWLFQQRVADSEKLNSETKTLFDDLVSLASKRHFRTRRLFWAIQSGSPEKIEEARSAYDNALTDWNEAELSWKVRFVKNLKNGTAIDASINDRIRVPFVKLGNILEKAVRLSKLENAAGDLAPKILSSNEVTKIEETLICLSSSIFEISREIYGGLDYLNTGRLDEEQFVQKMLEKQKFEDLTIRQMFRAVITSKQSAQFS